MVNNLDRKRILIANRGEIALRAINAARSLNFSTVSVYSTHKKRDKGEWHKWPVTEVAEDNKHFMKSVKEAEAIIEGYKVTSKSKMLKLKNGNIAKNSYLTVDFKNLTRKGKGLWKGKPYNIDMKCKKVES